MNYSEHHTPWENSEDKSEHISSVSFILCTFAAHIYICLHPLNNKGKQGSSIAWFVIISELERNLGEHIPPGICNALYPSHTLVFPSLLSTHSQTSLAAEETNHGSRRQSCLLKFRMQNLPTPVQGVQGRDRREQDDRGVWTEQSFIPQIDLANTAAYEQSTLPQRPPCPPASQGMVSDMTNIDFPRGIYFPDTSEVLSQISNQTAGAVCI